MSWRDNLHLEGRGSFRGVEFFVDSAESEIGRRIVVHKYPGRDDPGLEDNGREPRQFRFECFVLGDDYMAARDQLREAFEKAGPGPLVHPYWGSLTVVVDGQVRIQETPADGGMARFTLNVIEVGNTKLPQVQADTAEAVDKAADEAAAATSDEFEEDFSVIGYIAAVAAAATNLVNAVASDLAKIKGYVNAAMAVVDSIGDAIETLADTVAALILLPGQLVSAIGSVVTGITEAVGSIGDAWNSYFGDDETPGDVAGTPSAAPTAASPASADARVDLLMRAWREMSAFGDDLVPVTGSSTQTTQAAANQAAFVSLIKRLATIEVCRTMATLPFSSATKANEIRDELFEAIDDLLEDAGDALYGPLVDLRTALVNHLSAVTADLPQVITYTPRVQLPALVLSQILYGSSRRAQELIDRNNIRNPCAVPARDELEILSDE